MRILADESVSMRGVRRLRDEGHDVGTVHELARGAQDSDVLNLAARRDAVLLTGDTDFGELVFRQGRGVGAGVVLTRLDALAPEEESNRVAEVIARRGRELVGQFTTLTPHGVRIVTPPAAS